MKKHLFFAATAALVLASCSSDSVDFTQADVLQAQDDNSVQFDTYMGKTGTTRAYTSGPIANETNTTTGEKALSEAGFGVFAYHTHDKVDGNANYDRTNVGVAPSNIAPNFMYNQEITWNASSPAAWVYTPVKYWPNGIDKKDGGTGDPSNTATQIEFQKLSFFAVAPFTATPAGTYDASTDGARPTQITNDGYVKKNGNTNGINAMTTNAFTGNVWVKYLLPTAQEDEAVDLLWGTNGKAQYEETDNTPSTSTTIGTGYNVNLTKQIVGEKVKFLFKHALTKIGGQTTTTENAEETPGGSDKIGFKIVADIDGNNGDAQSPTYFPEGFKKSETLITLKAIRIQDKKTASGDDQTSVASGVTESGIYNSGWFNIETGSWEGQASDAPGATINIIAKNDAANQTGGTDDTDYSINPDIREAESYSKYAGSGAKKLASGDAKWDDAKPTGIYATAVPVFAKETVPGVTLIPGDGQKLYITVDYFVRTADKNLATGYTQVEQKITNEVSLASLQSNKYYTIIIHLGMTSVKFEAVVADWETNDDGSFDENGHYTTGGGSTPNETKVWLPSNVVVVTP